MLLPLASCSTTQPLVPYTNPCGTDWCYTRNYLVLKIQREMILAALIDATRGRNYSILNTQDPNRDERSCRQVSKTGKTGIDQSCQALAHSQHCNIQLALQNFEWGFLRPISVPCLFIMNEWVSPFFSTTLAVLFSANEHPLTTFQHKH